MAKAITKDQLGDCLDRISDYFIQMNEDFDGATSSVAGEKGMVPAPSVGDENKFLRGDGTWAEPSGIPSGNLFVASPTHPDNTSVIWFKTESATATGADFYTGSTQPSETDVIWFKTLS